jgi:hypothetical protein
MSPSITLHSALIVAATLLPLSASAQRTDPAFSDPIDHSHALSGKLGTSGPGFEYSYSRSDLPMYGLRANLNYGQYSRSRTVSDVLYRGTLEFRSIMLLADAHPYRNGFRMSAGLVFNDNRFRATGQPKLDTFNLNGSTYPATAVESLDGEVYAAPLSPYFGVGWGSAPGARGKFFYSFDFGLMYQRADVRLSAACTPSFPAAECARLQADLLAEEVDFRSDLIKYGRWYPILTFGAGYRF